MKITNQKEFQILKKFENENEIQSKEEKKILEKFKMMGFVEIKNGKANLNPFGQKLIKNEKEFY